MSIETCVDCGVILTPENSDDVKTDGIDIVLLKEKNVIIIICKNGTQYKSMINTIVNGDVINDKLKVKLLLDNFNNERIDEEDESTDDNEDESEDEDNYDTTHFIDGDGVNKKKYPNLLKHVRNTLLRFVKNKFKNEQDKQIKSICKYWPQTADISWDKTRIIIKFDQKVPASYMDDYLDREDFYS